MHWAHSFKTPTVAGRPFGPDPAPAPAPGGSPLPLTPAPDPKKGRHRARPDQARGPALDHFVAGRPQAEEGDRHHGNSSIQLPGRVLKLRQVPGLLICSPPWATAATSALSPPGVLSRNPWLPHDCPAATAGSLSLPPAQSDSHPVAGAGRCTPGSAAAPALGPP